MRHSSSIGFFLLMMICGYSFAQPSFRYKRKVESVGNEGWYSITLPGDIFQNLNSSLTDLRLYTLGGVDTIEIPYLLRVMTDEVIERRVELPLFNTTRREATLYFTFELQPSQKVNSLNLEFDQENYFAHVTLEGSDDRLKWFEIAKDERIMSIQKEEGDYRLSSIRFPLSSYRYLRVAVTADISLDIKSATFSRDSVRPGNYHDVPLIWQTKAEKDRNETTVHIRLKEYAPVSSLSVQVDNDSDYYRHFRLEYVMDSTRTNKGWIKNYASLLQGYLTSFDDNIFEFPVAFCRDLRLVIANRDDAPLKIAQISATGPHVTMVTRLKPGDNNYLFYGAGLMRAASYDLAHFQHSIPDTMSGVALGAPERIAAPEDAVSPLFEDNVWLWAVMAVLISGLGFFTLKMMRSS